MVTSFRVNGRLSVSILLATGVLWVVGCAGGESPAASESTPTQGAQEASPTAAPTAPASSESPTSPAETPSEAATPTSAATAATETTQTEPTYGGTLRQANTSEPPTFDVQATSFSLTTDHTRLTHSRLVRYKSLLSPENAEFGELTFQPDLAESWDISEDGQTFTFHLRDGVRWPDVEPLNGRELVAQDVVDAFRRIFDADEGSPTARFREIGRAHV